MKFTSIKHLELSCFESVSAVPLGDKLLVFCSGKGKSKSRFFTYSVGKNEWYSKCKYPLEFEGFVSLSKFSFN